MKIRATMITGIIAAALIVASVGCDSDSDDSASPADFYRGKTIELIVSSSAGGSTDRISRVVASYLERDTGANVVVTNMKGAGGLEGMNYLYRSEPDGLTLGMVSSVKFVANDVMDEPAAAYDIENFCYIMNIGRRLNCLMVSPDGPYKCIEDLQAGEDLKLGGSSPSGVVTLAGLTLVKLLDLDAKIVTGITEETDRALAVKRGEIAGYVISVETAKGGIDSDLIEPMFVLSTERQPSIPEIPAITELTSIDAENMALIALWETALVSSTIFNSPPGMPEDRLEFLRDIADKWEQDEEFREEITAAAGENVDEYITGSIVNEAMQGLAGALDEFRAIFAELIEKYRA